jgi:hypothetical protein
MNLNPFHHARLVVASHHRARIRFDPDMVAHVVSFLRKTGVGFSSYPNHQVLEPDPTDESVEEVGPVIGDMLLDLAI